MIRRLLHFVCNNRGAAGAEMALLLPLLTVILFGGIEVSHFFWTEHQVLKSVRNGSRFAARHDFALFDCGAGTVDADLVTQVQKLTRTGYLDGDADDDGTDDPIVRNWSDDSSVTVELECVDGEDYSTAGIYRDMTSDGSSTVEAMRVVVNADVAYPNLFGFGFLDGRTLTASAESPVMGF